MFYATIALLIIFYCISLPLGYVLAFKFHLGLAGLWYGQIFSLILLVTFYIYLIFFKANWHKVAQETQERLIRDRKSKG